MSGPCCAYQRFEEVKSMNGIRRIILGAALGGSLLTGAVVGATIAGPVLASAAGSSSTAAAATPAANSGKFVPNETAAHEAGESAAREAQEDAGQVPTVP
jgi:hypothetical protein